MKQPRQPSPRGDFEKLAPELRIKLWKLFCVQAEVYPSPENDSLAIMRTNSYIHSEVCEANYSKESLTFTITPTFQFNSWVRVETSLTLLRLDLQNPNDVMSRRLQNARYDLLEGVTIKITAPSDLDLGQRWAIFTKTQQLAVFFQGVMGNDVANKLAFQWNKWSPAWKNDALGLPTVYQLTPAPKRFDIIAVDCLGSTWKDTLETAQLGSTIREKILVAFMPFYRLDGMRNVGIFDNNSPSRHPHAMSTKSIMEATPSRVPIEMMREPHRHLHYLLENACEMQIWSTPGETANMLRLEKISSMYSREYTIHPNYHAMPLAEAISRRAARVYALSRTLHPNSLELQTLLRAATEETHRVTPGAAFFHTYLNPPDLHRMIQVINPTLTWREKQFRDFLRGKREEFKTKGDWNPRVGECTKRDWFEFYPFGIPVLHLFGLFTFYTRMLRDEDILEAKAFQKNIMAQWTERHGS